MQDFDLPAMVWFDGAVGNRLKKPSKTKPVPKKLDQTAVPSSERGHGNVWYDKMDKQHSRGSIAD